MTWGMPLLGELERHRPYPVRRESLSQRRKLRAVAEEEGLIDGNTLIFSDHGFLKGVMSLLLASSAHSELTAHAHS
eukprot:3753154-Rhodomonas_salina.1